MKLPSSGPSLAESLPPQAATETSIAAESVAAIPETIFFLISMRKPPCILLTSAHH
ncbi:hypothetical protein [Bifidobacterium choerinum]|uniref:hypothetical protein n=1 Tax=Bifidobacterium choerinum TaxID=35760 RepID=UPI000A65E4A7|nr:hypothetical protein [Bifidobacterium choerinum]